MRWVVHGQNFVNAYHAVMRNQGAAGVDGMPTEALPNTLPTIGSLQNQPDTTRRADSQAKGADAWLGTVLQARNWLPKTQRPG